MSSTLWDWGRACCFSYEKLIVFSCVICFGEEKTKNTSQSAHGGESLVNALMNPLEQCIAVVLIPKARECISSLNLHNDSHGIMISGRYWKSCLSFPQSWWLQFWWCPGGREEVCNQTTNAEGLLGAECGREGSKGSSWTQQVWHGKTKREVRTSRRPGTLNATGRQKGRLILGKELYRWKVRCEMGIAHVRREGNWGCWWGKKLQDGKQRFKVQERPSS